MDYKEKARVFSALSDPLRLRLMSVLARQGETCGKELARELEASVALVSHHTKILEDAGLIIRRRDGQFSRFSLDRGTLAEAFDPEIFPACADIYPKGSEQ